MPCTLEPWEIEVEESRLNKSRLGKEITDERAAVEAACQACRLLEKEGKMDSASPYLKKWWKLHQKEDKKRNRAKPTAKKKSKVK